MGIWGPLPGSFDSLAAVWCNRVHYLLVLNWYHRACHIVRAFSTFLQNLHSQVFLIHSQKYANCTFAHPRVANSALEQSARVVECLPSSRCVFYLNSGKGHMCMYRALLFLLSAILYVQCNGRPYMSDVNLSFQV